MAVKSKQKLISKIVILLYDLIGVEEKLLREIPKACF